MSQERDIAGTEILELGSGCYIEYEWTATAQVRKHNVNSYESLKVKWPVALFDHEGNNIHLTVPFTCLLGYHTGDEFAALHSIVQDDANLAAYRTVQDLEYDYDSDEGERADRAYDEARDRKSEENQ